MARIRMFTQRGCGSSDHARELLTRKGIDFDEVDVTGSTVLREGMIALAGASTTPQIMLDGQPIGGADALDRLDRDGVLDSFGREYEETAWS